MRVFDNGSFYSVQVSARDVETFNVSWPCSSLPERTITFQFDKDSGDLVDVIPSHIAEKSDGLDLAALSDDAQAYGKRELGL